VGREQPPSSETPRLDCIKREQKREENEKLGSRGRPVSVREPLFRQEPNGNGAILNGALLSKDT